MPGSPAPAPTRSGTYPQKPQGQRGGRLGALLRSLPASPMVLGGGGGEARRRQRWRRQGLGPARRRRRRRRRRPRGARGGGRRRERARGRAQSGAPSRDSRPVSWRRVAPLDQQRRGAGRGSERRRGAEEEGRAAEPRTKGRRGRGEGRPGALGSSHRRSQPERCPVRRRWEGPEPPPPALA